MATMTTLHATTVMSVLKRNAHTHRNFQADTSERGGHSEEVLP